MRPFIRTVMGTMLIALLALAGTVGSAFAASAGPTTIIVSPGSRVCLPVISGSYKVHGVGDSNRGVRFSLHGSTNGGLSFNDLAQSSDTETHWVVNSNSASSPGLFPGQFKLCARNLGAQGATVTLTLQTDANAP